jgi:hypothetical protein
MTTLIISALAAIACANAAVWWMWGRHKDAYIRHLTTQIARLVREQLLINGERDAARRAWQACEWANGSLRARNEMLSDLVGGERP